MSKTKISIFFFIVAIQSMAANFAHPVTPTLIHNLKLPDYSFGLLFAGMAFTNFLFSPMWSKIVKKYSSKYVLGICCIGYGLAQAMFGFSSTLEYILIARMIAGFFVGGIMVSYLTYVIYSSNDQNRGKLLAMLATFTSVFATFGYLIGGVAGTYSIQLSFILQSVTLILSGILFYVFLDFDASKNSSFTLSDCNPLNSFKSLFQNTKIQYLLIMLCVLVTSLASTCFDQSFNYYIKDIFNFSSSYNGILKAITGLITLIFNMTLCVWIFKNTNVINSCKLVLLGCATCLFGLLGTSMILPFIVISLVFFGFNALYIPLLQDITVHSDKSKDHYEIVGLYNSMKSLGMILGALIAGYVYDVTVIAPFIIAAVLFVISIIILHIFQKLNKGV